MSHQGNPFGEEAPPSYDSGPSQQPPPEKSSNVTKTPENQSQVAQVVSSTMETIPTGPAPVLTPPSVPPPSLPPGWIAQVDPVTQRTFYANTSTGETQWDMPISTTTDQPLYIPPPGPPPAQFVTPEYAPSVPVGPPPAVYAAPPPQGFAPPPTYPPQAFGQPGYPPQVYPGQPGYPGQPYQGGQLYQTYQNQPSVVKPHKGFLGALYDAI